MKKQIIILLLSFIFVSCSNKKKQDNRLSDKAVVTFVIKDLPKTHNFKDDIYISGDFEGWSGGKTPFKLHKKNNQYSISIPENAKTISYKFTLGNWDNVECKTNGNPIENRTYSFLKSTDTVTVNIANWSNPNQQNKASTAAKNVHVFAENFDIPQLQRHRKISVYLPPNYESSNVRYPVLYMQDGQNVFDEKTSYSGEWDVDETLNKMFNETGFGLIVVAIDHGGNKRLNEYSAWDNKKYGKGEGALYLKFLMNNLKPEIDRVYRTKTDSKNTGISGSSMGGLFAHYAAIKRPDVFGKAAVFSPSFWYADASFQFTKSHPNNSKFYYVVGEKEGEDLVNATNKMVELMQSNGFSKENIHQKTVPHGTHSESFWKTEFKQAISWLFINE
ncbi:alpha/beta hydrolase-fold protein [Hwangdonia lutea]|uniref:Alpha/beta hydrolase-fold protein n=1 Tax=Hwangdonia lutea TaxID=3075823 RepID=A0AA97HQL1_9FLAO|nr:alpha/beta hydrolase-fold protein [Hwangdonia sp. SCSIO 19198]WOD42853.1 alpha/beta hydrolase-fold protein [Hwangdonia sp. SCSIO 19198]